MERIKSFNTQVATKLANNLETSLRELRRCGDHRSSKATLVEMGIQLSGFKNDLAESDKFAAMVSNARIDNAVPYELPSVSMTVTIRQEVVDGLTTYVLNDQGAGQRIVVYLTGGAYLQRPDKTHWQYLDRLARQSGAKLYVPIYSLAPQHTFRQAYQELAGLYSRLYELSPASEITLMGDSAGGGIAVGFCEYLGKRGLPQPGHLILFSPWLDLDLTNPVISKYEDCDVTLAVSGLRKIAAMWAGDEDHNDYRLSPLRGNLEQLRDVAVYAGTREIMYPDATQFVQKLRQANIPVYFSPGRGLFHIFPLYQIPEARAVMKQVVTMINK